MIIIIIIIIIMRYYDDNNIVPNTHMHSHYNITNTMLCYRDREHAVYTLYALNWNTLTCVRVQLTIAIVIILYCYST